MKMRIVAVALLAAAPALAGPVEGNPDVWPSISLGFYGDKASGEDEYGGSVPEMRTFAADFKLPVARSATIWAQVSYSRPNDIDFSTLKIGAGFTLYIRTASRARSESAPEPPSPQPGRDWRRH